MNNIQPTKKTDLFSMGNILISQFYYHYLWWGIKMPIKLWIVFIYIYYY